MTMHILDATQTAQALPYAKLVPAIAQAARELPGGQIRGALLDQGGAMFKGIPFAQPPVGDRRWRDHRLGQLCGRASDQCRALHQRLDSLAPRGQYLQRLLRF